ncbi:MAG: hypothetical protein IT204_18565 [Fimbriimonadaceae bacterium]|nr:hypothetical protein [Fimbriimonadaceae bacterium]
MKRWMLGLGALAAITLYAAPTMAEDAKQEGLSLTVTDEDGEEWDLIEEAGGDALVVFVDPEKFDDDDADDLEEALNAIAEGSGDEGDDEDEDEDADDKMAAVRQIPGVTALADEDKDQEGDEEDGIEVVLVLLTDNEEIWDEVEKEWDGAEFQIVLADPKEDDEELDAFELPENLVWSACLVIDSAIEEAYDSVEDLTGGDDAIIKALNEDDDVEEDDAK